MKKVIIEVVQNLSQGGIEVLVLTMFAHARLDEEMHLVSLEQTYQSAVANWPRLKEIPRDRLHFLNKAPGWSISCMVKIIQLIRQLHADVIHAHHIGPLFYAGLAAVWCKVPVRIYTEHDVWHLDSIKHRYLQRFLFSIVKPRIAVISQQMAIDLQHTFSYKNIQVIYNGVDVEWFAPGSQSVAQEQLGLSPKQLWIGSAGRLVDVKGQDRLMHALTQLPLPWSLVFAGQGPQLPYLRELAKELKIEARCVFLGTIDTMPLFYQAIDLFCLPSLAEGMPLAILEAQACSKPVVTTNVGGASEALCPKTGRKVPPNDPQALTHAILERYATPLEADPREFVVNERSIDKMMTAYRGLMGYL
jgi:glycosyltransferase involved in cell wall biosynthesis